MPSRQAQGLVEIADADGTVRIRIIADNGAALGAASPSGEPINLGEASIVGGENTGSFAGRKTGGSTTAESKNNLVDSFQKGIVNGLKFVGIGVAIAAIADVLVTGFKPLLSLLKVVLTLLGLLFLPIAIPLVKALVPVVQLLSRFLSAALNAGKSPAGAAGAAAGAVVGGAIGSAAGPVGTVIGAALGSGIGAIIGDFIGKLAASMTPIFTGIVTTISNVLGGLGKLFAPLVPIIDAAAYVLVLPIRLLLSTLELVIALLLDGLEALAQGLASLASSISAWIMANVITPLATFLRPIIDSIVGFVGSIADWISTNIIKPIATFLDPIITAAKTFANGLISAVNSVIDAIKGITVANPFGGTIAPFAWLKDIPLIPMAQGGIVTGPTPILAGERGPEAIIPLSKGLGGNTINVSVIGPWNNQATRQVKAMMDRHSRIAFNARTAYARGTTA